MISISSDAGRLAVAFEAAGYSARVRASFVTRTFGSLLQTRVKGRASGRPGPRAPTGDYRRSISLKTVDAPNLTYADVGTNAPQGRRLEYGFVGVDSLGRHYNQPPYPHFGPALRDVEKAYAAAIMAITDI